jgi:hypothetical protein
LGESSKHQLNHGNLDHRFTCISEVLVVPAQATVSTKPTEGPLNNPASWQHVKTDSFIAPSYDFQGPLAHLPDPLDQLARVGAIGPNQLQSGETSFRLRKQQFGPIPILDVGGMDHDGKQQPHGIYQDVPLATVDLLVAVIPMYPPFSVVFTVWLSTIAALGCSFLPAVSRTFLWAS